jgi:purine-binding chemotaxis protein CheW
LSPHRPARYFTVKENAMNEKVPTTPGYESGTEQHVVVVEMDGGRFALNIHSVQEVVRMQKITDIPGADSWVEGITNLRGKVVPVIDLRRRCGIAAADQTSETRIVVVTGANGLVGLVVDAVSEVMRIPGVQVEGLSTVVSQRQDAFLNGVAKVDDGLISMLDLELLLPAEASFDEYALAAA